MSRTLPKPQDFSKRLNQLTLSVICDLVRSMGFRGLVYLTAAGLAAGVFSACNGGVQFSGQCSLPNNQTGSLMAPVSNVPLHVIADTSFTSDEQAAILAAASVWNNFGATQGQNQLFDVSTGDIPDSTRSANLKDCSQPQGSDTTFYMIREQSMTHWQNLGFTNMIPGATLRCAGSKSVSSQTIMINDEKIDPTQMQTVVLHELGHSLGLDHSCQSGSGSSSFIGCDNVNTGDPYHLAIMFPSIQMADPATNTPPEIKNNLTDNDQARAICEYQ